MKQITFKNELNLKGHQDCLIQNNNSINENCCSFPSGIFEDGYYEYGTYNYKTYDQEKLKSIDVGISQKMEKTNKLWDEACKYIPGGGQTFSKSPMCFIDGVAPKFLEYGKGSRVWDVDGNQYIDYVLGCFPLTLGYSNEYVDKAISEQLKKGITFSMMHRVEVEFAKSLNEIIPCAEMVRYGKNGSDATTAAVRLARAVTKRDHVICFGYHGSADWYIGTTDRSYGVPKSSRVLTTPTKYNDIEYLKKIFEDHPNQISCLIMEPTIGEFPKFGYLDEVKNIVHHYGALLIFDEMLTGFRFHIGGAQALFGTTPDLAAFGKGVSNGMPIGILVGKQKYMKYFDKVFFSSTYGGEALSLAAGIAGLQYYKDNDVIKRLWKSGRIIFDNFFQLIKEKDMNNFISIVGYPVRQQIIIKNQNGEIDFKLISLFQQEMFKRGILCFAGLGFSSTHSDEELMYTVYAFAETLEILKKAINENNVEKYLEGKPIEPVFRALREQKITSN